MSERVLAINPGSTSTKMAVFSREGKEIELKVDMDHRSKGNSQRTISTISAS
jgi:butyrate kinase